MKFLVASFFIFTFSMFSSAQILSSPTSYTTMSVTDWNNVFSGLQPLVTQSDRKLKGTPFLYEEFILGSIYLSDSIHSPEKYKFNLNIQTNEIWMINDEGQQRILTNPRIMALVLNKDGIKHTFKKLPLPQANTTDRKFVEMFYCGSITLVKEIQKIFTGAAFADQSNTIVESSSDSYETRIFYYLADEHGIIQKVKLKLSDVFDLFPKLVKKHKSKLDSYCKEQQINKNLSEEKMTGLLNYMSELRSM
ncbi:MAG: hypothetical protein ABI761_08825 [Saprospiraceae bacterium]